MNPEQLAELEKTVRYAADRDIRVLLMRDLTAFLAEYDRRGEEIAKLRIEVSELEGDLEDQQEQFDQLISDIGGVSPG